MKNNFLTFLFVVSFVVAQFFTHQAHQLTHSFSETKCEPEITVRPVSRTAVAFEAQEDHQHCKFLRIVSAKKHYPLEASSLQDQQQLLKSKNLVLSRDQIWISHQDSSYHQARAPPVI